MDTMVCISYQIPEELKVLPELLNVRVMAHCLLKTGNYRNIKTDTVICVFLCKRINKEKPTRYIVLFWNHLIKTRMDYRLTTKTGIKETTIYQILNG